MSRPGPTWWDALTWMFARWGNVDSFGALSRDGIPSTEAAVRANVRSFLASLEQRPEMFNGPEGLARFRSQRPTLDEQLVRGHFANAQMYLDAAVLIFAHSILSQTAKAALELVRRIDKDAVSSAESTIPRDRDMALSRNMEVLRRVCGPEAEANVGMASYVYDLARLQRLDRLRSEVVHGDRLGDPISLTEEDVEFMKFSGTFALMLVFQAFSDRMGPALFGSPPTPATGPPSESP